MPSNSPQFDASLLTEASRRFAGRLFDRFPALASSAQILPRADSDEYDLRVEIPSPSGDANRQVVVWMEGDTPSVGFGEWHTHADVWACTTGSVDATGSILELIEGILADQVVLTYDVGGPYDGHWGLVDLRDRDALLEELTSKYSPGRVNIRTWSSRGDRQVGLEDYERENPSR